jgi:prepilin-type processing-associated H-X9-DG protein
VPADRHSGGSNLSFADGHVEHWVWKNRKRRALQNGDVENEADLADLRRLEQRSCDESVWRSNYQWLKNWEYV